MNEFKYDKVVLEEVFSGLNKKTFKSLVRLQYQVMMECYLKGINYSLIYPTSWQSTMRQVFRIDKWVSKKSSVEVVKELLQIDEDEKISNDLAEAILIGLHYLIKVKGIRFENITYKNCDLYIRDTGYHKHKIYDNNIEVGYIKGQKNKLKLQFSYILRNKCNCTQKRLGVNNSKLLLFEVYTAY